MSKAEQRGALKETSFSAAACEEIPLTMLSGEADAGEAEASTAVVLDSHFHHRLHGQV